MLNFAGEALSGKGGVRENSAVVNTYATSTTGLAETWTPPVPRRILDARWSWAFAGLLFYTFIEYTRLPEMYPVLAVLRIGQVALILTTLAYLFSPRILGGGRVSTGGLDVGVFAFIAANFISACLAPSQANVWSQFINLLELSLIYFLVTRILTSTWRLRILVFLVLLLNLKMAQFTIRDYRNQRAMGISDMQVILRGGAGAGSKAFFGNAADLGLAMVVVWAITFALLFGKTEKKRLPRYFLIVCFALFLLAILFCGSRGAVLGAATIVAVALARTPKKIGAIVAALVFLCGVWFVLPDASKDRFRNAWEGNDKNAASRLTFWRAGVEMFSDYPVFGVGPGNFPTMYAMQYSDTGKAWACHSIYVQALSESGVAGTAVFAALLILTLRLNSRTRKLVIDRLGSDGKRTFEYCLAIGLDLALVGYLASGAFLAVLYYPHLWILLGLSVATHRVCANLQPEPRPANSQVSQREFSFVAP
jgi:putative inorganic carbon (hco3(-)) transporter